MGRVGCHQYLGYIDLNRGFNSPFEPDGFNKKFFLISFALHRFDCCLDAEGPA